MVGGKGWGGGGGFLGGGGGGRMFWGGAWDRVGGGGGHVVLGGEGGGGTFGGGVWWGGGKGVSSLFLGRGRGHSLSNEIKIAKLIPNTKVTLSEEDWDIDGQFAGTSLYNLRSTVDGSLGSGRQEIGQPCLQKREMEIEMKSPGVLR